MKVAPEVGRWILGSKEKYITSIVTALKENTVHLELPYWVESFCLARIISTSTSIRTQILTALLSQGVSVGSQG